MLKRTILLLACLFGCLPATSYAATYYNGPSGSDANSCLTATSTTLALQKRSIAAGMACLGASDTLIVHGGTYDESLSNPTLASGSAGAPTIIQAAPGETVLIKPSAPAPGVWKYALEFRNNTHHVTFDGIGLDTTLISNTSSGFVAGTDAGGNPHDIEFKNAPITTPGDQFPVILVDPAIGTGNFTFTNLTVRVTGSTSLGSDFYHCFYLEMKNSLIQDSDIAGCHGAGIQVVNNYASGNPTGVILRRNVIHDLPVTTAGQRHWGIIVGSAAPSTQIYDNVIYGIAASSVNSTAIDVYTGQSTQLANNTIADNGGLGISFDAGAANGTARNNILYLNASSDTIQDAGTANAKSNNLQGPNPNFANQAAHDYRLMASSAAAIDLGVTLTIATSDKLGTARPQGSNWDIGAYEYIFTSSPATYYVAKVGGSDANSCTLAKTLATAKQTIAGGAGCVVGGGDVVLVRAGIYAERIFREFASGSSWSSKVRIANYNGEVVTLQPTGVDHVVDLDLAERYIEFDGINLDARNVNAGGSAIKLESYTGADTHHIRFQNLTIQGSGSSTGKGYLICICGNASAQGFHEFLNVTVQDGNGSDDTVGGYLIQVPSVTIAGGSVTNVTGTGIEFNDGAAVGSSGAGGGLVSAVAIHDFRIAAAGQKHYGVKVTTGTGTIVKNSPIYGLLNTGSGTAGISLGGVNGQALNDTVYNVASGYGVRVETTATGAAVKNLISYANGTNYSNAGASTTTATNITAADPQFVSAGTADFRIFSTSPAAGLCTTLLSDVPTDFLGTARTAPYDCGIYKGSVSNPPPNPNPNPPVRPFRHVCLDLQPTMPPFVMEGSTTFSVCHDGKGVTGWAAVVDGRRRSLTLKATADIFDDGLVRFTGKSTFVAGEHVVQVLPIYGPAGDGPLSLPFLLSVHPKVAAKVPTGAAVTDARVN